MYNANGKARKSAFDVSFFNDTRIEWLVKNEQLSYPILKVFLLLYEQNWLEVV